MHYGGEVEGIHLIKDILSIIKYNIFFIYLSGSSLLNYNINMSSDYLYYNIIIHTNLNSIYELAIKFSLYRTTIKAFLN